MLVATAPRVGGGRRSSSVQPLFSILERYLNNDGPTLSPDSKRREYPYPTIDFLTSEILANLKEFCIVQGFFTSNTCVGVLVVVRQ